MNIKTRLWASVAVLVLLFALALFALYKVHPTAPLFLLASLVIQVPIIVGVARAAFGKSYVQRAAERRSAYEADKNAKAWLAGEQAEADAPGYKYWSKKGKSLSALNRAEAAIAAGEGVLAASLLAQSDTNLLGQEDVKRHTKLLGELAKGKYQL